MCLLMLCDIVSTVGRPTPDISALDTVVWFTVVFITVSHEKASL